MPDHLVLSKFKILHQNDMKTSIAESCMLASSLLEQVEVNIYSVLEV